MKVLILGPVITNKTSGGVAVFTEGLYKGFKELGDEVQVISTENSININNIKFANKNKTTKDIFFSFKRIGKLIKKYQPKLVISSLQYSLGIKRYKHYWKNATYVQVLHGMPCKINGKIKERFVNLAAKYSKKHFDKTVTVSYLSYAINKKMNLIECDEIIHNGCDLLACKNNVKIYDITYVGRLYRDKEVELICDSFLNLLKENPNLKLCVAGYGELEGLFKDGKYKNSGIIYLGKQNRNQVNELLSKSKFFISMNPLEPFGICYSEAVINKCNIITQSTVGAMPLFISKEYFHVADCINKYDLSIRLKAILDDYKEVPQNDVDYFLEYFKFKNCAQKYKNLITK